MKNKKIKLTTFFVLSIVFLTLFFQASNDLWKGHLQTDAVGHFGRIGYFLQNGTFKGMGYNEYQPGVLLFFLLTALVSPKPSLFSVNLTTLWIVNFLLILGHIYLYKKITKKNIGSLAFLIIILLSGPILLFRFELIVSFLMILAYWFWKKKKYFWSFFSLGIGTSIKIFPILILPYFCLLLYKKKEYKNIIAGLFSFILSIAIIFLIVNNLGISFADMVDSLSNHGMKPVGIESVSGTILTLVPKIAGGDYARGYGQRGVEGLDKKYLYLPMSFYNWLWIVPLGMFYLFLFFKDRDKKIDARTPFLIILLFLVLAKNFNPQYMFWFIPFFPIFSCKKNNQSDYFFQLGLLGGIVLLTQYVYPLAYSELTAGFYATGRAAETFYILFLRNFLAAVLFVFILKDFVGEKLKLKN